MYTMNLLLDEYADNPVIDEVVYWPPKCVLRIIEKKSPFGVEVIFNDNSRHITTFENMDKANFQMWWQEAHEILELVTNIEVIGSMSKSEREISEESESKIFNRRNELIQSCLSKYQGYENDEFTKNWFVEQFGFNCSNLPESIKSVLDAAANT